jgi:hypothetical protein
LLTGPEQPDSMENFFLRASYHSSPGNLNPLHKLYIPPSSIDVPANFPDVEMPQFLYGDRLRWKANHPTTDWGIVIGRFYSFAPHCRCWQWCYLIWLDPNSPSSDWLRADIAWEDDLEPFESELL